MANPDRLTGLDSSFLHLERDSAHMHVAGCMVFDGRRPDYDELVEQIVSRLHLVPRYRQRLAFVPLNQGRPVWVDDPHFNVAFHVRHTALPQPRRRAAAQAARRPRLLPGARPQPAAVGAVARRGPSDDRFALLSKTHHALVDGVSGVDIATVLFDSSPDPMPVAPPDHEWVPRPLPSRRAAARRRAARARHRPGRDRRAASGRRCAGRATSRPRWARRLGGVGAMARAGLNAAPVEPVQRADRPAPAVHLGHAATCSEFKAVKNALGGTVNDVVLAAVAGALGRYLRLHGEPTEDVVLKAMVPVSVRADVERGALGNRVAAMWAPLPVGSPIRSSAC